MTDKRSTRTKFTVKKKRDVIHNIFPDSLLFANQIELQHLIFGGNFSKIQENVLLNKPRMTALQQQWLGLGHVA